MNMNKLTKIFKEKLYQNRYIITKIVSDEELKKEYNDKNTEMTFESVMNNVYGFADWKNVETKEHLKSLITDFCLDYSKDVDSYIENIDTIYNYLSNVEEMYKALIKMIDTHTQKEYYYILGSDLNTPNALSSN